MAARSLRLEIGLPRDLRPFGDLGAHPGIELRRAVAPGVDAEVAGAFGELRRGDHGADVGRSPGERSDPGFRFASLYPGYGLTGLC